MSKTESKQESQAWDRDLLVSLVCGFTAFLVMGAGAFSIGIVSKYEAKDLVAAIMPTSRFLCSAVMTSSSTIAALMLTLLGLSLSSELKFSASFYRRIKKVTFYDTIVFTISTCFLVLHCLPLTESENIPEWWHSFAYYFLIGMSAFLGGALVFIVVLLYSTVKEAIAAVGLGANNRFIMDENDEREL